MGVETAALHRPRHSVDERVHRTAGAKHPNRHEHRHEIGNDTHGRFESRLGSFHKCVVDIDFLAHARHDEGHDEAKQQDIGTRCAHAVHHRCIERGETPDDAGHCQGGAAECEEQRAVEEVDALKKRGDDHAGQGRKEGGQEDRDENVRGIGRTLLCTIDHDGDRNEREPTCVEHQEHNHGIARAIFLRIEFLQSFHGLEAERSGGIVESKHVGGDIHKDVSHHRMAFRHFGKEAFEERPEQSCHKLDHSAAFADLHHPHPEGKYSGETDRNFKSRLGRFESGVHDGRKHVEVAEKQQAEGGNHESDEEKGDPNIIEYHGKNKSLGK